MVDVGVEREVPSGSTRLNLDGSVRRMLRRPNEERLQNGNALSHVEMGKIVEATIQHLTSLTPSSPLSGNSVHFQNCKPEDQRIIATLCFHIISALQTKTRAIFALFVYA